ncbi:pentapeptide repeat protein [Pseudobacteroides cellulosolvens ATCC 35603 = DSM 2933]|uniref:Pentapeptide repeat protein n=1 Tax=Pseudobacteroides cellulosolvens ATCC 35603 = DSM 2933 TaxID=398512 RepID=A0A0L6JWW4_9FIRM|nr:pentapeptide repeat-containing protein [Pseudobacteroides cellulosolvens]KNY30209.1 pentapeptide repeat protein [Pseudobacteroides cellulosolvens ATCC 35603 = DSM 2933]
MEIKLERPNSVWTKPVKLQPKLFKEIAKFIMNLGCHRYDKLPEDIMGIISEIGFKDSNSEKGWVLISGAIIRSTIMLIIENKSSVLEENIVTDELEEQINTVLENEESFINYNFFENPKNSNLINAIKPIIRDFFSLFKFENDITAENLCNRFPSYFVFGLIEEWNSRSDYYKSLEEEVNKISPFDEAGKKEKGWIMYYSWMQKHIDEPMFSESFSLKQVYVPLRAYYKVEVDNKIEEYYDENYQVNYHKVVVDLEKALEEWINSQDKNDSIRIISGGPGYGKSSFLKIFAAKLSERNDMKILFIPLHQFKMRDDLEDALKVYIKDNEFLNQNPLDMGEKLLIIFDGLDELAMQGKALAELANQFIDEIIYKVGSKNAIQKNIQVMVSGRDVIIQKNEHKFRSRGQILNILPYYIQVEEKENTKRIKNNDDKFIDNNGLLSCDQRHDWWSKYGKVKGKDYKGLPELLSSDELDEITTQPLLNYLIALSYERGKIDFSENPNLNEIYNDLLEAVYLREYEDGRLHTSIRDMEQKNFFRVLEEIAIASWHGNGRTASVKEIKDRVDSCKINNIFNEFKSEAEKGVISLLTSFYFRKYGNTSDGDETFEFTHKSFGEYLTARRILTYIYQFDKNLKQRYRDYDDGGWDEKECLIKWVKLFGAKEIDEDLIKFIKNEICIALNRKLYNFEELQNSIVILINYTIKNGLPMDETPINTYFQKSKHAQNAEKSLFIILGLISASTSKISEIKWEDEYTFGDWISRLQGQRRGAIIPLLRHLNNLNIKMMCLDLRDFYAANLSYSNLKGASLYNACLIMANLREADLEGANLRDANLHKADLFKANLRDANLQQANLRESILLEADLRGAVLRGAVLRGVVLRGADLSGTDLRGADLSGADLSGVDLRGVDLRGVDLREVDLRGVDLRGAKLRGAKLREAKLRREDIKLKVNDIMN